MYYNKDVVGSYDCLLAGYSNEPETHLFLKKVIPHLSECAFVDVGASIGEFVIGVSLYENVRHIYAVEPRKECVVALEKTVELNNEDNRVSVLPYILSEKEGEVILYNNTGGSSSGIYGSGNDSYIVKAVTLDYILPEKLINPIILIDVEGAEPLVLKGGVDFIKKNAPLIIFEYNQVSKKYFNLTDIENIVGKHYRIYRIKGNGDLDQDFENSWNCVAIPVGSHFETILLL
jgi:FkbM family methyltransferase